MSKNVTKNFIDSLQSLVNIEPSEVDCKQVSRCLIDYLGATLSGVKLLKGKTEHLSQLMEHGAGAVCPIGSSNKVSLETAALINGLNSHEAEMDDGIRFGMVHPGAPLFSALLPVAQVFGVQRIDFVRGVLIGYEATIRLARAVQPSHYRRGHHPTATCGAIGAAMGIAAMLKFDAKEMENTLGAVSLAVAGSLKVVDDGSELKPYNVGRAAALAIQSSMVGKAGFATPPDVLNGSTGFFAMTTDQVDLACLAEQSPSNYWIHHIYVKPYAACRHAHPSIEGAIALLKEQRFHILDIKRVTIYTYHGLKGRHDNQGVTCPSSARMSIPFSVAIALSTCKAGIVEFATDSVSDPIIKELSTKVFVEEEQAYTDLVPNRRPAKICVELKNGQRFSREVIYAKGEPENPLTDKELENKYIELALFAGVSSTYSQNLLEKVWEMPENLDMLFDAIKKCTPV